MRYDFQINFETSDVLDVDRLLVRDGVVTEFKDGANNNDFQFILDTPADDSDRGSE